MNAFQQALLEVVQEIEANNPEGGSKATRYSQQLGRQAEACRAEQTQMKLAVSLANKAKGLTALSK